MDKSQQIPDILGAIIVVILVFACVHAIFALWATIDVATTVTYMPSNPVLISSHKGHSWGRAHWIRYAASLMFPLCCGFGYFIAARKLERPFWRRVLLSLWYGTIGATGLLAAAGAVVGLLSLLFLMMISQVGR